MDYCRTKKWYHAHLEENCGGQSGKIVRKSHLFCTVTSPQVIRKNGANDPWFSWRIIPLPTINLMFMVPRRPTNKFRSEHWQQNAFRCESASSKLLRLTYSHLLPLHWIDWNKITWLYTTSTFLSLPNVVTCCSWSRLIYRLGKLCILP